MLARMWSNRNSHSLLVKCKNSTATLADNLTVPYKTKHTLTIDPVIMLLGISPNKMKIYVHTETCTWKFIAVLFIITKTWKQPRSPSVDEWLNKLWYIQAMEYH